MKRELLSVEKLIWTHHNNRVFDELNMTFYEGETQGIICDSIVERNALVKFFGGQTLNFGGKIRVCRKLVMIGAVQNTMHREVAVIARKSKLISSLSITENICIFADKGKMVHTRQYSRQTTQLAKQFKIGISLDKPVLQLTEKERIVVELLKAYQEKKKVVVMADISGVIQYHELLEIYAIIQQMKNMGCAFVLIESYDDMVFNWTDQLLIIKNGRELGCFEPDFVDRETLYKYLLRGDIKNKPYHEWSSVYEEREEEGLRVEELCTEHFRDLSFSVERGEILKLFFVDHKDLENFKDIFWGKERIKAGKIYIGGQKAECNTILAWKEQGLSYSFELPYKNMIIPDMTLRDNLMMDLSLKVNGIWFHSKYKKSVDQYIEKNMGPEMGNVKLRSLPPDMIQKVHYSRYILAAPKVLICEKPFTEVDLHIKESTLEMFGLLQSRGIAIIVATTNLSALSMVEGDTVYIRKGEVISEDELYQEVYGK